MDLLSGYRYPYEADELRRQIATLTAERDKLKAMVVWAVLHGANAGYDGSSWPTIWYGVEESHQTRYGAPVSSVEYDGTPASIIVAVERAMGEAK